MTALIDPELILGEVRLNADQTLLKESTTDLEKKGLKMQVLKSVTTAKKVQFDLPEENKSKNAPEKYSTEEKNTALSRLRKRKAQRGPELRSGKRAHIPN